MTNRRPSPEEVLAAMEAQGFEFDDAAKDELLAATARFFAIRNENDESAKKKITKREIETLGDLELDDRLWLRHAKMTDYFSASALRETDEFVRAFVSTRAFEREVFNGGIVQYCFNFEDPDHLEIVAEGYKTMGLRKPVRALRDYIIPAAAADRARSPKRKRTVSAMSASYQTSSLPQYDLLVEDRTQSRLQFVRKHPSRFAV